MLMMMMLMMMMLMMMLFCASGFATHYVSFFCVMLDRHSR
jgi:hypothetical protein